MRIRISVCSFLGKNLLAFIYRFSGFHQFSSIFFTLCRKWPRSCAFLLKRRLFRVVLDVLLSPSRKIVVENVPPIDLLILVAHKDEEFINTVIDHAIKSSINKFSNIYLVVPRDNLDRVKAKVHQDVNILSDEDLISEEFRKVIYQVAPENRRGWLNQQVIKMVFVRNSASSGVLVLDADTVLLGKSLWLDDRGRQVISLDFDQYLPYENHFRKFLDLIFRERVIHSYMSFVTHYQLMQPVVLREIFPSIDDLRIWIEIAKFEKEQSPASEYHTYGRYITQYHPESCILVRWGNANASNQKILDRQPILGQINFKGYESVSIHSYLQKL